MKRPQIIERIRQALSQVAPGAKAILYGSEARGDARPDSDIDLLVLVDELFRISDFSHRGIKNKRLTLSALI